MIAIQITFAAAQVACLMALIWHMRAMDRAARRRADASAEFAAALRASASETQALLAHIRATRS